MNILILGSSNSRLSRNVRSNVKINAMYSTKTFKRDARTDLNLVQEQEDEEASDR